LAGDTGLKGGSGILIQSASNTIGGLTAGVGNVITGFAGYGFGIELRGKRANANLVQGNFIGTKAGGDEGLGNRFSTAVYINGAADNIIGGTDAAARNIIADHFQGVFVAGRRNVVQGNFIGTNKDATAALGNREFGIVLAKGAVRNIIGGAASGAGNILSGNLKAGITLDEGATHNKVQGNFIGTGATKSIKLGNGRSGVQVLGGSNNLIGGRGAGAGNVIAYNQGAGVDVLTYSQSVRPDASKGNAILRNSIFSNTGLGINLGEYGSTDSTPNDDGDGDTGPNNLQNSPVLTAAFIDTMATSINGSLNSLPNTTFRIEFFTTPANSASPAYEGKRFVHALQVTTDATGNTDLDFVLFHELTPGHSLTATATRLVDLKLFETSEFSNPIVVTSPVSSTTAT